VRLLVVLVTASLLIAGCSTADAPRPSTEASSASPRVEPVAPVPAPGIEHVHNLALLPDSTLLVGTHEGLWRQDSAGAELDRIGEPFDVMGFFASSKWLASGHPAPGSSSPPDLGLLRSNDEGRTWRSVSLGGTADFHRLVGAGPVVLGANSGDGLLWRSEDHGKTWQTLGPAPFDIAMDPNSAKRVIGTTSQGPIGSDDGGRSWQRLGDKKIALVNWTQDRLYGVATNGTIHGSDDAGMTWTELGTGVGVPEAFAAQGDVLAVLSEGTVWVSEDRGESFTARVTGIPVH